MNREILESLYAAIEAMTDEEVEVFLRTGMLTKITKEEQRNATDN